MKYVEGGRSSHTTTLLLELPTNTSWFCFFVLLCFIEIDMYMGPEKTNDLLQVQ